MVAQSLKLFLVVISGLTLASRARTGEFCVLVYPTTVLVGEIARGVGLSTLQASVGHSKQYEVTHPNTLGPRGVRMTEIFGQVKH